MKLQLRNTLPSFLPLHPKLSRNLHSPAHILALLFSSHPPSSEKEKAKRKAAELCNRAGFNSAESRAWEFLESYLLAKKTLATYRDVMEAAKVMRVRAALRALRTSGHGKVPFPAAPSPPLRFAWDASPQLSLATCAATCAARG